MRFISQIQWIPWKLCFFQMWGFSEHLEEPRSSLINTQSNRVYWLLFPVSDWVDSLIGPSGLLLVVSPHLLAVPISVLWVGLEKKLVRKTWMWEIFLQSHILSVTVDATQSVHCLHCTCEYWKVLHKWQCLSSLPCTS